MKKPSRYISMERTPCLTDWAQGKTFPSYVITHCQLLTDWGGFSLLSTSGAALNALSPALCCHCGRSQRHMLFVDRSVTEPMLPWLLCVAWFTEDCWASGRLAVCSPDRWMRVPRSGQPAHPGIPASFPANRCPPPARARCWYRRVSEWKLWRDVGVAVDLNHSII